MQNTFVKLGSVFSLLLVINSCGNNNKQSFIKTIDIPQTEVKTQAISSCWAYATMGWIESLMIKLPGGLDVSDLSETYSTYKYIEYQLLNNAKNLQTEADWNVATTLLLNTGVMLENDFVTKSGSRINEANALAYIVKSMQSGALLGFRTAAIVKEELNKAYDIDIDILSSKQIKSENLILGFINNQPYNLDSALKTWSLYNFPLHMSQRPYGSVLPIYPQSKLINEQEKILYRMKKALNDSWPVILGWHVDKNAFNNAGIFSLDVLKIRGVGEQGYHMTVIKDYITSGITTIGQTFYTGENDVSLEYKNLALNYGKIEALIVKNSWGVQNNSYVRNGLYGYTRLDRSYLFGYMPKKNTNIVVTGMSAVVLPQGY